MATVGTKLTIPFIVGAGQIVGQGNQPELWCIYTTDDVSNTSPAWSDASQKVRSFSVSRGRANEQSEFDVGACDLVLDNRTRLFDQVSNANIKPFNRWWLRAQFSGETHDLFKGYADSYDQSWPGGGFDAVTAVHCSDEFKVLALDALPTTSPPRDSYNDVVDSDAPAAFWDMNEDPNSRERTSAEPTSSSTPQQVIKDRGLMEFRRADRRRAFPSRHRRRIF